jgi:hypothetical protein
MRLSLKWILAGMVYVAVAAAAFWTGEWYFADALSVMTMFALMYAIAVAMFDGGKGRAMAVTFCVGCACFLLWLTLGGDGVPVQRLLVASRVGQTAPAANAADDEVKALTALYDQGRTTLDQVAAAKRRQQELKLRADSEALAVYLRAANAVATMAFGLMGSLVGLLAFRSGGAVSFVRRPISA